MKRNGAKTSSRHTARRASAARSAPERTTGSRGAWSARPYSGASGSVLVSTKGRESPTCAVSAQSIIGKAYEDSVAYQGPFVDVETGNEAMLPCAAKRLAHKL